MSEENRKKKFWSFHKVCFLIIFLILILFILYVLILFTKNVNGELITIRKTQIEQFNKHAETNQFLLSTIDWSSRRINKILFMRDQIETEWVRAKYKGSLDEAYKIAETIMKETENYSYIEPFFVLATQFVESSFIKKSKSKAGALGINQIMPSTGRLLAQCLDLEYTDSLLYSIPISTKMSIKLFDILYAQYGQWDVVLADYNGGPWQAYYYKNKNESLAKETFDYIPAVLNKKMLYDSLFLKYRVDVNK
ncbi:MAG: transglycosylase SLT domain-containing protein [Candidatus Nanoarchaeia archaeon]|jgi:soluble lytic murein transglycosylase-like protein|nr:transglycosylase SLT domain-containing protein [Candidatus Nanoarchaeia archaeon]